MLARMTSLGSGDREWSTLVVVFVACLAGQVLRVMMMSWKAGMTLPSTD